MSSYPRLRRTDKSMSDSSVQDMLVTGYSGHLATVGADGIPYSCPLLYVWLENKVWLHNSVSTGHLLKNIEKNPEACFSIAEAGQVFSYGRYECDTTIAYKSVIVFGNIEVIKQESGKVQFFEALMSKYSAPDSSRPKSYFPRLDGTTVYAMSVNRVTGKETTLPALSDQWPKSDNTKSPNARGA